jgi:hypothetical protein
MDAKQNMQSLLKAAFIYVCACECEIYAPNQEGVHMLIRMHAHVHMFVCMHGYNTYANMNTDCTYIHACEFTTMSTMKIHTHTHPYISMRVNFPSSYIHKHIQTT